MCASSGPQGRVGDGHHVRMAGWTGCRAGGGSWEGDAGVGQGLAQRGLWLHLGCWVGGLISKKTEKLVQGFSNTGQ